MELFAIADNYFCKTLHLDISQGSEHACVICLNFLSTKKKGKPHRKNCTTVSINITDIITVTIIAIHITKIYFAVTITSTKFNKDIFIITTIHLITVTIIIIPSSTPLLSPSPPSSPPPSKLSSLLSNLSYSPPINITIIPSFIINNTTVRIIIIKITITTTATLIIPIFIILYSFQLLLLSLLLLFF